MLQRSTMEPGTLEVLKSLMAMSELDSYYLVGDTALALYHGHMVPVHLDLFSITDFQTPTLSPPFLLPLL